jgi:precorrin-6Y C5,15-methyltransferase (decarboxylating)
MGTPGTLTAEGLGAVQSAELLIGAPRLLEAFACLSCEKLGLTLAGDISAAVRANDGKRTVLLFSGDIGFYSGAERLYSLLGDYDIETIPGISSLSYLAAKANLPWQDALCLSAHGRRCDCAARCKAAARPSCLPAAA